MAAKSTPKDVHIGLTVNDADQHEGTVESVSVPSQRFRVLWDDGTHTWHYAGSTHIQAGPFAPSYD